VINAYSVQTRALISFPDKTIEYRLERRDGRGGNNWETLAQSGFIPAAEDIIPTAVSDMYFDEYPMDGICQYRARAFSDDAAQWDYTPWMRRGTAEPIGYMYGNYHAPVRSWGDVLTPDDLRGYLWGIDFRASNGASYTDTQIQYFIDSALKEMERLLNITIKKTRVACEPQRRGLKKGVDYDEAEPYYTFKRERVERSGIITTRKRPVISISRIDLVNRNNRIIPLLRESTFDSTKGRIKFFNRLPRQSDSTRGVETAIYPYGAGTLERELFYAVDYIAGFESSDDVPKDLREIIGKKAAVSLLNIIGRGLMSGFSSSSLSMDGVSESFSSTQSATSAYYGADIKEYKDDIENYISENKMKFGHIVMGAL
jgi:hypothetical protein